MEDRMGILSALLKMFQSNMRVNEIIHTHKVARPSKIRVAFMSRCA